MNNKVPLAFLIMTIHARRKCLCRLIVLEDICLDDVYHMNSKCQKYVICNQCTLQSND